MRNAIVLLGALALIGCSRDKVPQRLATTTTTTTKAAFSESAVTVDDVRAALLEHRPAAKDAINSVIITNEGSIITLRGRVDDEATRQDMVSTVRAIPSVQGVSDQLQVSPRQLRAP